MKVYKLNGLDYCTVAFSKSDAIAFFWLASIGVTENNLVEVNIEPNRDAVGKVFKTLDELKSFEIEY